MQPSSLIFLVIVAIWAAYLVQHWVRRREHVATARSVDRFSEAMRVLERRSPLPSSELSAPHPRSYAVKPASSRPAVVVKRASAVRAASALGVQVSAMVADRGAPGSPLIARSSSRASAAAGRARSHGAGRPAAGGRPTGGQLGGQLGRSPSEILGRRVRGVAFLVSLGAIPVTLLLSALHVLLWVSVLISVVAFAAVVAWLRTSALRDHAARGASRSSRAANPAGRAGRAAVGRPGAAPADVTRTAPEATAGRVFDVTAPVGADVGAGAVEQQVSLGAGSPGAWSPVPVPPPTYTLKDTATRAVPEPAEVTQTPVPIEVEDDEIERLAAEHHRRVVGG